MRKRCGNVAFGIFLLATGVAAAAAPWHCVGGYQWDWRVPVVVENPSTAAVASVVIRVPLDSLAEVIASAKAGHVAVVDPAARPERLGESGGSLAPFQMDGEAAVFTAALAPKQERRFYLYGSERQVPTPAFVKKTGTFVRAAYRCFESDLMGFRVEVGLGANTTGMAIDVFGKTAEGRGLQLRRFYESVHGRPFNYHQLSRWGMDILHVGPSPGLGGLYFRKGRHTSRPRARETSWQIIEEGPVRTVVRVSAPLTIAGAKLTVVRTMALVADDRSLHDTVELLGAPEALADVELGVGLRRLPDENWVQRPTDGLAYVYGKGTESGVDEAGLGVVFDPAAYLRTDTIPGKEGGHILYLRPRKAKQGLVSRHRLAAYWDQDGQIATRSDFERVLSAWSFALSRWVWGECRMTSDSRLLASLCRPVRNGAHRRRVAATTLRVPASRPRRERPQGCTSQKLDTIIYPPARSSAVL